MSLSRPVSFAAHVAASAQFVEEAGWLRPGHYRTVEEEVGAARRGALVHDLVGHGVFSLVGPDARRFCNGMFTQNVRDMAVGAAARSALTDEKGKMLGLVEVARTGEEAILVVLDGITPEAFSGRYGKFIVLDDVEMEDLSAARVALHLGGPSAGAVADTMGLPAVAPGQCAAVGDVTVLSRDRGAGPGLDLVVPAEVAVATWEAARGAGAMPVGFDAMEWLRVSAGLARWPADMGERALVHEMRLVESCCSFEKGCYVGQEVINRIDVMGQVNKKLLGLAMRENAIPPLEAEVRLGGEAVGVARSGARCGGRARVLALLRKAAWTPGTEVEVVADGRSVAAVVSDLPFS
ncbi:MAG: aminomethyltransferase family protein [Deltaproteobacteria bacterium]|nr:aminomethyltransferase family protein [Deltaproteobacteria bacterium]